MMKVPSSDFFSIRKAVQKIVCKIAKCKIPTGQDGIPPCTAAESRLPLPTQEGTNDRAWLLANCSIELSCRWVFEVKLLSRIRALLPLS